MSRFPFVLLANGHVSGRFTSFHAARRLGLALVSQAWASGGRCDVTVYRVGVPGWTWAAGCGDRHPVDSSTKAPRS